MHWSERSENGIGNPTASRRRRYRISGALAAAVALLLGLPWSGEAGQSLSVRGAAEIIDGDSLTVSGQSFDLAGVDAPELGQRCHKLGRFYDCGALARAALMDLTAGAEVDCRPLSSQRTALQEAAVSAPRRARCQAGGYDLSEGMVYTGWALIPPDTAAAAGNQTFAAIQAQAEQRQHGLWKGAFVVPWAWRNGQRLPDEAGN